MTEAVLIPASLKPVCLAIGEARYGQFGAFNLTGDNVVQSTTDSSVQPPPTVIACTATVPTAVVSTSPPCIWYTDADCSQPSILQRAAATTSWHVLSSPTTPHDAAAMPPWLDSIQKQLVALPPSSRPARLSRRLQTSFKVQCLQVPHRSGGGKLTYGRYRLNRNDHRTLMCEFDYFLMQSYTDPMGCLSFRDSECLDLEDSVVARSYQEFYPSASPWTKSAYGQLNTATVTPAPTTSVSPVTTPPPPTTVPPLPPTTEAPTSTRPPPSTAPPLSETPTVPPSSSIASPTRSPAASTESPSTELPPIATSTMAPRTTSPPPTTETTSPAITTATISSPTTPLQPLPAPTVFANVTSSWKCCYSRLHLLYTPAKIDVDTNLEACLVADRDTDCRFFRTEDECAVFLLQQPRCVFDTTCTLRVKLITVDALSNSRAPAAPPSPVEGAPEGMPSLVWVLLAVFVVLFAAVVLVFRRRRQNHAFDDDDDDEASGRHVLYTDKVKSRQPTSHSSSADTALTHQNPNLHGDSFQMYQDLDGVSPCSPIDLDVLDFGELPLWRLDETHLLVTKVLSIGAHGLVAKGDYKGRAVAIKKLRPSTHPESNLVAIQTFVEEIKLLSQLESPYIVSLVGVCWDDPRDVVAVMDYMPRGDLRTFLQRTPPDMFPWTQKIDCAGDMCHGLVYLHSLDVMHRDLKSRNVLLNADLVAKLSDFGLSRHVDADDAHGVVGSFRYAAPEVLAGHAYTEAADMFALGMLLWELDVHEVPFAGLQRRHGWSAMALYEHLCSGELDWLEVSGSCPGRVIELIKACTAVDPSLRPTAVALADVLDNLSLR